VLDYAVQVSLDCVIYCAFYSILFGGGVVFSGHGVVTLHRARLVLGWVTICGWIISALEIFW